ncbi:MAG: YdeI/OmpD-associated family protein [Actinomycetota bacterium]|nr:YdeI/OmpD-associated family protein [Actinomycetota bacterium]
MGFYKKATGRQTMSWSEAVDQALCFGWIDGKVNRIDDERHRQRFTPRRPGSNWSKVNVEKVAKLEAEALMTPAGRRAFEARSEGKTGVYSFEQDKPAELPEEYARQLLANAKAADFFAAQPPWYRKAAAWWVVSAKREETRARRLATLIEDSENGRPIRQLTRPGGRAGTARA